MKKTISILSVFTVSFFYSQENNNDTKNENENKIISKKDFNFDSNHKNIIKIENQKPIHIEIFQYNNKEYKIKKNKSINDINLSIFNKNYSELEEKFCTLDWRLAKRQLTWLRRNSEIAWCDLERAYSYIAQRLADR